MLDFIKKYVFFMVDVEDKINTRNKVKGADHRGFQIAVLAISLFQIIMLFFNIIRKGWAWSGYVVPYRILYIALAISSLIFCILLELLHRKNSSTKVFYAVVVTYLYIVLAWCVGISVLDSYASPTIITFAYVVVTAAAFITIEPWGYIGAALFATIALNVTLLVYPNATWSVGTLINSISVFVLASMVSIFTFYRRVNSVFLEREVQELNNELEAKAYIDDLTKLYNRRYLSECMVEALDYSINGSGIILFDIDNFKKVNDTYGHLVGDSILRTIGELTMNQNGYSYCVRYGGEEMMVFFKNVSNDELFNTAEKLRKEIEATRIRISDDLEISVTISIGIAKAVNNINYNKLIDNADDALYKAKKNGKNQTMWYKEEA